MSDSIMVILEADTAKKKWTESIINETFFAEHYESPAEADIAKAGPDWKPSFPVMKVDEMICPWPGRKAEYDDFRSSINTIFDTKKLPEIEVEELEVININLSDYPLPENPTSYDWWWA